MRECFIHCNLTLTASEHTEVIVMLIFSHQVAVSTSIAFTCIMNKYINIIKII